MDQDEFRGEVIFTFDGDSAGQQGGGCAPLRTIHALSRRRSSRSNRMVSTRVTYGSRAAMGLRDLVAKRVPMYEFAIRSAVERYDLSSTEGNCRARRRSADRGPASATAGCGSDTRSISTAGSACSDEHSCCDEWPSVRRAQWAERVGSRTKSARLRNPARSEARRGSKVTIQAPVLARQAFDALDGGGPRRPPCAAVEVAGPRRERRAAVAGGRG